MTSLSCKDYLGNGVPDWAAAFIPVTIRKPDPLASLPQKSVPCSQGIIFFSLNALITVYSHLKIF